MNVDQVRNPGPKAHAHILIAIGTLLLLNSLNLISINFMSLLSVVLILYGLFSAGYLDRLQSLIKQ